MKTSKTTIVSKRQRITSVFESVSIDVEPKRVVHTSPLTFEDAEKMFRSRYPRASAPTDIIAIAASPLIFALEVIPRRITAATIVSGKATVIGARLQTVATASAPNATCASILVAQIVELTQSYFTNTSVIS